MMGVSITSSWRSSSGRNTCPTRLPEDLDYFPGASCAAGTWLIEGRRGSGMTPLARSRPLPAGVQLGQNVAPNSFGNDLSRQHEPRGSGHSAGSADAELQVA